MNIQTVCGILIVAALLVMALRQYRPDLAMTVGILAGLGASFVAVGCLSGILQTVNDLFAKTSVGADAASLLIKAMGICLLTQLTADVCRDAGESHLASRAEFAGKTVMLILALPLFKQVLELALLFVNGSDAP